MLHFGDLNYYSVPSLPHDWEAPMWLKLELGIYAGRLYFELGEYHELLNFLAIRHTEGRIEISEDTEEDLDDIVVVTTTELCKTFTRRPLTFLQEWLAIRRNGQNFDQTPMGFVCQGKMIPESHHFFAKMEATVDDAWQVAGTSSATSGSLQVVEVTEEDFEDEDQGEIVRPEDLKEDFDVSKLNTTQKSSDDSGESD